MLPVYVVVLMHVSQFVFTPIYYVTQLASDWYWIAKWQQCTLSRF